MKEADRLEALERKKRIDEYHRLKTVARIELEAQKARVVAEQKEMLLKQRAEARQRSTMQRHQMMETFEKVKTGQLKPSALATSLNGGDSIRSVHTARSGMSSARSRRPSSSSSRSPRPTSRKKKSPRAGKRGRKSKASPRPTSAASSQPETHSDGGHGNAASQAERAEYVPRSERRAGACCCPVLCPWLLWRRPSVVSHTVPEDACLRACVCVCHRPPGFCQAKRRRSRRTATGTRCRRGHHPATAEVTEEARSHRKAPACQPPGRPWATGEGGRFG